MSPQIASGGPLSIRLEPSLDLKSAAPLLTSLRGARGRDVALEAGEVRRVGGQCLQVLIAARAAWAADGRAFEYRDASAAFIDGVALMGASDLLGLTREQDAYE
jgi:chemotaxis protein CheX